MGAYVTRRIGVGLIVLVLVSMITFAGVALAPGDALTARVSPTALAEMSPADIAAKRHALGLDQPMPIRYVKWLNSVVHGDLGYSSSDGVAVGTDLADHVGPTLILMAAALLLGILVALPLGVIAAMREHTVVDYVLSAVPIALVGIPAFVVGLVAIYLFSVQLGWLPTGGLHRLGDDSAGDLLVHLLMPGCVLAIVVAAPLLRYMRASMLDTLRADYMVTARSKGLPARTVIMRHGFRNALLPVITVIGILIPQLIAGTVIVENVFGWPGMGQLAVRAAGDRDVSVMLGVVMVVGATVVAVNILTDLVYAYVDPRLRLS